MPLAEVQRALAHLYTDAAARERLRVDPAGFAGYFSLDKASFNQVASMGDVRLRAYTDSLDRKRAAAAVRELPLCARLGGTSFRAAFLRFARETQLGEGPSRYRDDALAFAAYVARSGDANGLTEPARSLLAYEVNRAPGVRLYACDVRALARATADRAPVGMFERRMTVVVRLPDGREFGFCPSIARFWHGAAERRRSARDDLARGATSPER